jgi:hypothetical protein
MMNCDEYESNRGLFENTTAEFGWRNRGKPQKTVRIVLLWAENPTWGVTDTKQGCQLLNHNGW